MTVQEGCRAELEGATFVGHSDLAATKNAPAISMEMCHEALVALSKAHVQMRGALQLLSTVVGFVKRVLSGQH
jgi:hypothetical protein